MQTKFLRLLLTLSILTSSLQAQQWQQVGDLNRPPRTLYNDTVDQLLYIGGEFRWSGLDTIEGICTWNGNSIQKLNDTVSQNCGSSGCLPIITIIRYQDGIYVGPGEDKIGPIITHGIARWDGHHWSAAGEGLELGGPTNPSGAVVYGTYVHEDKLYAVGAFLTINGDTCNSVAYWDGIKWNSMGFPDDYGTDVPLNYKIIYYKNEFYVGGNCYNGLGGNGINNDIARYDGLSWKQVGGGLKGGLSDISDMVIYKDELYVCGYFRKIDGNVGNKIMRWDGVKWKDVGGGLCFANSIATDMMVYGDKLYIVGIFDCVGNGLPARDIAVWDGEHWCSFGNSYIENKLSCIEAYNGDVYIGGGFTKINGYPVKYLAKWIGDHSTDTCQALVGLRPDPVQVREMSLSPNPASDWLVVEYNGPAIQPEQIRLYDFSGRACHKPLGIKVLQEGRLELQTADLPSGIYCLTAVAEDGKLISAKFVKR